MIDKKTFGFQDFYEKQITEKEKETLLPARIIEIHREFYRVISEKGENGARLKGSVFYQQGTEELYPTIGDFVLIQPNTQGDDLICRVLARKSHFSRLDPSTRQTEQTVAANFDYVLILASLNYDFNPGKIERYVTESWQSGGIPIIILTKADLVTDYAEQLAVCAAAAPGVDTIVISAVTGEGLDELKAYLRPNTSAVLLGSSGVGKSSLVNALAGEKIMDTQAIREDDSKGRHTTTHRQIIQVPENVMIMDTPGMRELGVFDAGEGLSETFSDLEALFTQCRFRNCSHSKELGCAVNAAIKNKTLDQKRWNRYQKLQKEIAHTERKRKINELKQQKRNTPNPKKSQNY